MPIEKPSFTPTVPSLISTTAVVPPAKLEIPYSMMTKEQQKQVDAERAKEAERKAKEKAANQYMANEDAFNENDSMNVDTILSKNAGLPESSDKYKAKVKDVTLDEFNPNRFDGSSSIEYDGSDVISEKEYNNLRNKDFSTVASVNGETGYATKLIVPDLNQGEDSLSLGSISDYQTFELPDWGVEDYINDRTKWVKGVRSIGDEPGWFYFKVFFKFNTNYGLFGSCLKTNKRTLISSNTALRYLNEFTGSVAGIPLYRQEQIPMRINALIKFTQGLSKINSQYPWMIKGINGLEQVMNAYTQGFSEEKSFELVFNTESTDMRLITLLNLYKYACYDDMNCKEIIPENLRKFDMMVVFYHVPVKYFQTAIMVSPKKNLSTGIMGALGGKWAKAENIINKTFNFLTTKSTYYKYKRMAPDNNDFSNMMSFQMFTFQNCEFDVSSFSKYFEGAEIKNEQSFQFSETAIKIKYDRVFFHNMNEWNSILFGSDGFWYDRSFIDKTNTDISQSSKEDNFSNRLQSLKQAREGAYFYDKNAEQYKSLIEYSESLITDGLMSMDMKDYYSFIDGNIYGKYGSKQSDYFKNKMEVLHNGNIRGNLYGKLIGPSHDGGYFAKKIERIKKGTVSGNIYEKILGYDRSKRPSQPSEYMKTKIHWLNDGTINADGIRTITTDDKGNVKVSGELISLYNQAKDSPFKIDDSLSLFNLFQQTPNSPFERDPVETKKKEIWNYALTGSSKSSMLGGVLDAAQSVASFWKW